MQENYIWVKDWSKVLTLNDKRVEKWLLMVDPTPSLLIILVYVIFCYVAPRVLKGRSFAIDNFVRVYNLAMVIYSFYIPYELYRNTIGYHYWPCEPLDRSNSTRSMAIAAAMWHYYFPRSLSCSTPYSSS